MAAVLKADPGADGIEPALARRIARSLPDGHAAQLTAIYEEDPRPWREPAITAALHRRGLVRFTPAGPCALPGGTAPAPGAPVHDVAATAAGRDVVEAWDILHLPYAYQGPALGPVQASALHQLAGHHGGRWWPGCGWSLESTYETTRILVALARLGLARRAATRAGEPEFTLTRTGQREARPYEEKLREVRASRSLRTGRCPQAQEAAVLPPHGHDWPDVRDGRASSLVPGDVFIEPAAVGPYQVNTDGTVAPHQEGAPLGGIAWEVNGYTGQTYPCISHTGRTRLLLLHPGTRVLKVVTGARGQRP